MATKVVMTFTMDILIKFVFMLKKKRRNMCEIFLGPYRLAA